MKIAFDKNTNKLTFPNSGLQPKIIEYDQLSTPDLLNQLKLRDKYIDNYIAQLKQSVECFVRKQIEKTQIYKLKLQQQIAQNQKSVKAFSNFTEVIINIIGKFQGLDKVNRESRVSIMGIVRDSISESSGKIDDEKQQEQSISGFSCIDQIVEQTLKLLQYLSTLTEDIIKVNNNLKCELAKKVNINSPQKKGTQNTTRTQNTTTRSTNQKTMPSQNLKQIRNKNKQIISEKKIQSIQKQIKSELQPRRTTFYQKNTQNQLKQLLQSREQQILLLKQQINQKIMENIDIKNLLQQYQATKNRLLTSISNALNEQMQIRITQMNKDQLIEQIKKLSFRIKELEKDKRQLFAKSQIERQLDFKKYQDLLQQIKQVRQMKISLSAG